MGAAGTLSDYEEQCPDTLVLRGKLLGAAAGWRPSTAMSLDEQRGTRLQDSLARGGCAPSHDVTQPNPSHAATIPRYR